MGGMTSAATTRVPGKLPSMNERLSFPPSSAGVSDRRAMLVGRASEMRELEDALAAAVKTRSTRIVSVIGAAGIGKTRLVRDFLIRAMHGHDARVFRGSAPGTGPPSRRFSPVLPGPL